MKGDFIADGKWIFEIGGKNKKHDQIQTLKDAFVVRDNIEFPVSQIIPFWLIGFLY